MKNPAEKPHDFLILVGLNISKYRKERGFSFEKLGMEIGLNSGHIYRMEKGYNITLLTLLRVAIALDITPEKLIEVQYKPKKEELINLLKDKIHIISKNKN